jgi:threonyl-tRNA synthetase
MRLVSARFEREKTVEARRLSQLTSRECHRSNAALPREPIVVTLPNGSTVDGTSFVTRPIDVAEGISKSLAKRSCVARVSYSRRLGGTDASIVHAEEETEGEDAPDYSHLLSAAELSAAAASGSVSELWDLTRPLEGDCLLELLDFESPEGKSTFWHSSAHVLGQSLEEEFGGQLTMGPPTSEGFYYDVYMGSNHLKLSDLETIDKRAAAIGKERQPFERLVLSREQALRLFADNPFKVQIISAKIPEGASTTAYRCGRLIDLCTGPHLPDTGRVGALKCMRTAAAFWLGDTANDALSRVAAVAFPDAKALTKHLKTLEETKKFDHRTIGSDQELFFFSDLSPGSAFFLPHGTRVYQRLQTMIREQYWSRGFEEVVTPNMFNIELWRRSGHAQHYLKDMFTFDVEGSMFGLKPMNCPAHCLMFKHRVRSHKELPLRIADFGALHRNEASGALTGLTRVRRFQQDDAHIFCREDQIEEEVQGALDFMATVYETLGFRFELDLSTRPKKAMGDVELWKRAELMMKAALERFGRPWKINPGDGAFYGPKIDVKVFDAFGRRHQCATIQLDFQLPIRFDLKYQRPLDPSEAAASAPAEEEAVAVAAGREEDKGKKKKKTKAAAPAPAEGEHDHSHGDDGEACCGDAVRGKEEDYANPPPLGPGFARPVMVHRAVLGSVERMFAVLVEHLKGKWPFWLSPRQAMVVPIHPEFLPHCRKVHAELRAQGLHVDLDDSSRTLNKKIREAQLAQYNLILVIGRSEVESNAAAVRTRDNTDHGIMPMARVLAATHVMMRDRIEDWEEVSRRVDGASASAE